MSRNQTTFALNVFLMSVSALIVLLSMHVYSLSLFRKVQAEDLSDTIRSDLVMGDRAGALRILESRIGLSKSFVAIILKENHSGKSTFIGDRYGDRHEKYRVDNGFFHGNADVPIYFDKEKSEEYGSLRFYYSYGRNSSFAMILWAFLTLGIVFFAIRQRHLARQDLERQLIIKRNETIAQMSAMIAHDLRAPLGTFERLLHIPADSFDQMRGGIKESLNRLHSMIEAFRHPDYEFVCKRVKVIIDFNIGLDSLRGKAEVRGITLIPPSTNLTEIWVDPMKFERTWINLVSNAIEAATSMVKLEFEIKVSALYFRVIDDGMGVPVEILPKLFSRGSTFGKADGTGLGLAYAKQVIMGHGGDIKYIRKDSLTIFECFIPNARDLPTVFNSSQEAIVEETKELSLKKIGVCLISRADSLEFLKKMYSQQTSGFTFHLDFHDDLDTVITNNPTIVEKCIEEGISTIEFEVDTDFSEIMRKSLRRLGVKFD